MERVELLGSSEAHLLEYCATLYAFLDDHFHLLNVRGDPPDMGDRGEGIIAAWRSGVTAAFAASRDMVTAVILLCCTTSSPGDWAGTVTFTLVQAVVVGDRRYLERHPGKSRSMRVGVEA